MRNDYGAAAQQVLRRWLREALEHTVRSEHEPKLQLGFFEIDKTAWRFHYDCNPVYPQAINLQGTLIRRTLKTKIPGVLVRAFPGITERFHETLDEQYEVQGPHRHKAISGVLISNEEGSLVLELPYSDLAFYFVRHLAASAKLLPAGESKEYQQGTTKFGCRHYDLGHIPAEQNVRLD